MTNDLGTLVIVVLKARNLPDKHTFYKQDAFAQVQLHDVTKKTRVEVKGGQHPVWDEEVRVPIAAKVSEETRTLNVSCWAQESRGPEVIGKGKLDITETLKTGEFDGEHCPLFVRSWVIDNVDRLGTVRHRWCLQRRAVPRDDVLRSRSTALSQSQTFQALAQGQIVKA